MFFAGVTSHVTDIFTSGTNINVLTTSLKSIKDLNVQGKLCFIDGLCVQAF